jgi:hypothetical protein
MKKIYSKPETQIKISQMDVFMQNFSIESNLKDKPTNPGGSSDEDAGVKERDLWSDGLW